jgi:uncharacterized protein YidB (DUF937 family)
MGLLDQVAGALGGQGGQSGQSPLLEAVMGMIGHSQGGLQGLLQQLQQGGLGDHVNSWVGTGQNMQVSGDQVQSALGDDQVQAIASQAGVTPQQASSGLAQLLPQIIDQLTPNGSVPENSMLGEGLALLKSSGLLSRL